MLCNLIFLLAIVYNTTMYWLEGGFNHPLPKRMFILEGLGFLWVSWTGFIQIRALSTVINAFSKHLDLTDISINGLEKDVIAKAANIESRVKAMADNIEMQLKMNQSGTPNRFRITPTKKREENTL